MICAWPRDTTLTMPAATVAMAGLLDAHCASRVTSLTAPLRNVADAVSCRLSPTKPNVSVPVICRLLGGPRKTGTGVGDGGTDLLLSSPQAMKPAASSVMTKSRGLMGAPQLPIGKDRSIPLCTEARGEACYGREVRALALEVRHCRTSGIVQSFCDSVFSLTWPATPGPGRAERSRCLCRRTSGGVGLRTSRS